MYVLACVVVLGLHAYLVLRCFTRNPLVASVLVPVFLAYAFLFVSLFAIEQGWWYSFELERPTFRNGAFLYLSLFTIPFTMLATASRMELRRVRPADQSAAAFLAVHLVFLVATAFLTGLARSAEQVKAGAFASLPYGNVAMFLVAVLQVLSSYYIITAHRRYLPALVALYVGNLYLAFAFQTALFHLLPPLLLRYFLASDGKFRPLPTWTYGVVVAAVGGSLAFRAASLGVGDITIVDRVLFQGQLFWASLNEHYVGNVGRLFDTFVDWFPSFRNTPLQGSYGLGHFMIAISPLRGTSYVESGVIFAGGSPGIFIYYFDLVAALVIYLVLGLALLVYVRMLVESAVRRRALEFVLMSLIGKYVLNVFVNGDYTNVNMRVVVYTALFLALRLTDPGDDEVAPAPGVESLLPAASGG